MRAGARGRGAGGAAAVGGELVEVGAGHGFRLSWRWAGVLLGCWVGRRACGQLPWLCTPHSSLDGAER